MKSELLSIIQKNFPLVSKPFATIAQELGSDEATIIKLISQEKKKHIIRQISPIFDTKRLGYSSSLVSFKIRREDIDSAVKIINAHPGVSHNYEREHTFNILKQILANIYFIAYKYATLLLVASLVLMF